MGGITHEEPSPKIGARSGPRLGLCRTALPFPVLTSASPDPRQRPADPWPHGTVTTR